MDGNLVLSRKPKETIHIGDSITITVARVRGERCTLSVTAPKDLKVVRGELKEREATK